MTDHVLVKIENNVLRITLNRADKKNAISRDMYTVLAQALRDGETNPEVRAIVIDALGDAFTAGNDLTDFMAIAAGTLSRKDLTSDLFLDALAHAQKPLIAAAQGLAVGIGVTMLLHCDLVFVADNVKLTTPFVGLGVVPEAGSSVLLQARIGYARAYAMLALGEPMDGQTAATVGLANAVVPVSELQQRALTAAQQLAARPIGALRATKRLMRDPAVLKAVMEHEMDVFGERLRGPEAGEALKAFAERRPPNFRSITG
jgi:enoyl-CoA hydratase/carnithine racemase